MKKNNPKNIFKNKKTVLLIFMIFALVLSGFVIYGKINFAAKKPIIFLLPHQDDELHFAGAIKEHAQAGGNVYVVMLTDGSKSYAMKEINGEVKCDQHSKTHNSKYEGYKKLSEQKFVQARNTEFYYSMRELGVEKNKILFANRGGIKASTQPWIKDNELTEKKARSLIDWLYKKYGDGSYKTVVAGSPYANYSHPDHIALFNALRKHPKITDKRYYSDIPTKYSRTIALTSVLRSAKNKALLQYFKWDPKNGRYAVGAHSSESILNIWRNKGYEYVIRHESL